MFYKWDVRWLEDAAHVARKSKDPSTKVGAVIVRPNGDGPGDKIAEGWNGFPRGIADTGERLTDRDMKLKLVVHAEQNAILNAGRIGVSCLGAYLYVVATDKSGKVWGGPPCTRCTVETIQSGIIQVISYPLKTAPSRWHDDCKFAGTLLEEARVVYREFDMGGCGAYGCERTDVHSH
jgi:dCMP deaminase